MRAVSYCALLLLTACTPMQWERQDTDAQQAQLDYRYCQQVAWREAQFQSYLYQSRMVPYVVAPGHVVYPSAFDSLGDQMLLENRLSQFCMESKGYQLVPAPKQ